MTSHQSTPAVVERIRRVETGIVPQPLRWNQVAERTTLTEHMAYYKTPGLSVALINHGEIEWAKGYGVLEAGFVGFVMESLYQRSFKSLRGRRLPIHRW